MPAAAVAKGVFWTFSEDGILRAAVRAARHTPRGQVAWARVQRELPHRSFQECRCRWRRLLEAKRSLAKGISPRNVCHRCGAVKRGHSCPLLPEGVPVSAAARVRAPTEDDEADETEVAARAPAFPTLDPGLRWVPVPRREWAMERETPILTC